MNINNLPKGEFKIFIEKDYFEILNQNGYRIYYEGSDGFWTKREYDSSGNMIYLETSEGYWSKREYDKNGNKIHFEDSKGHKYLYDSEGNRYT